MKQSIGSLVLLLLWTSTGFSQDLREQAADAWELAQQEEMRFRSLPEESRTRNEHLRIIHLYERVYLTTPHSGYSDDALFQIASLYEDTGADQDAISTLRFLVSDYPASRHIPEARERIARLNGESTSPQPAGTGNTPALSGTVTVDGVRFWESTDSMRVVVDMVGETSFARGYAENPPRVYVDVSNARVGPDLDRDLTVDSSTLGGIRIGQYDSDTVRIVLDLTSEYEVNTFSLEDPSRIVIDVLPTLQTAASDPPTSASAAVSPAVETAEPAQVSSPAVPTENGEHTLSRSLGLKVNRVVIDPGHGGHDPGTIGPSGLSEAALVLDIAKRVRARIESTIPNAQVILTREDDTFVPLETRPSVANEADADLFISIHANASRTQSIRGFETYFLNLNSSPEAMEIAARENAASDKSISDLQDIVSQIMTQEWVEESREFAGHIQKAMASRDALGRDRGVKQAPLVVLLGAKMPSILAEVSFISNPEDERLLKGDERRQEIADALFEGVRSYFESLSNFHTAEVRD